MVWALKDETEFSSKGGGFEVKRQNEHIPCFHSLHYEYSNEIFLIKRHKTTGKRRTDEASNRKTNSLEVGKQMDSGHGLYRAWTAEP